MEIDENICTLQVRLADKFGDLGMIGVAICRPDVGDHSVWNIDTWLMSCRVLGRDVERAMLGKLITEAKKRGVDRLFGTYIPTAKNNMVADHYQKLDFQKTEHSTDGQTNWALTVSDYCLPKLPMRIEDNAVELSVAAE